ncbi:flavodoxin domain-containing protein [Microbacterium immunditiarum]|uniref:Menaquinone-dependent protoporphyrinogen oxidase n=1 Tax=Microbacterium immunditiarum TaxID=337480 RepID=A0A7Y9KLA0_9MICO|nr:flavodoxin domain-containing protein [Microbacterium immunditiarum]NYE21501.1 menaquinone-dependent protoporphyrinogen oxidase [Microbacterium immunditiarum]
MRILVAYASKYGATEGIAERLGDRLGERGHEVNVRSCADTDDPSGYDAYVVGSAVYEFNWRKAARKFVERHATELSVHPVWLFASGPLGTEEVDKDGNDVLKGAEPKQFAEYEELLHPRGKQVFRGAYEHEKLRGADRMIAWMPALRDLLPNGDFRQWDAIDAWADAIADELAVSASEPLSKS